MQWRFSKSMEPLGFRIYVGGLNPWNLSRTVPRKDDGFYFWVARGLPPIVTEQGRDDIVGRSEIGR